MKEITKEDIDLLNQILKYTIVGTKEIENIEYFLTTYIDHKTRVCKSCGAQIRFAHKRIINWAENNKTLIENSVKNTTDNCIVCGKIVNDKRRKGYCSTQCKNK